MNILFIGPYRQSDGWGSGAQAIALSLAETKHNICLRPIYMANNIDRNIPEKLIELESKQYDKYDVVIQKCLPHLLQYTDRINTNIGFFALETSSLQYSLWDKYIRTMDVIWNKDKTQTNNLQRYGATKVYYIPDANDITKFTKEYPKFNLPVSDCFNFYFIGECIHRKNLITLSIAFNLEFHKNEPVNLIIKTNKNNSSPEQLKQTVTQQLNTAKQSLHIYPSINHYKQEIIITDRLTEIELCALHKICDCFVMPSHGEAWCRPANDAMGFGNPSIVTSHTGITSFINNKNGWLIDSKETPVATYEQPLPNIYTGYESWRQIDINSLRKCMRQAYENKTMYKRKSKQCRKDIRQYSYKNVAKIMEKALES